MVKNESREGSSDPAVNPHTTSENPKNVVETVNVSEMVVTNQVPKFQLRPQYAQSISDLQIQHLNAARDMINNMSTIQRDFLGNNYWKEFETVTPQYSEQIRNQSNEAINYFNRSAEIGNKVAINSINLARENIKNTAQAIASIQELNTNLWNSWNSLFG